MAIIYPTAYTNEGMSAMIILKGLNTGWIEHEHLPPTLHVLLFLLAIKENQELFV
jgi:hypothetical protein